MKPKAWNVTELKRVAEGRTKGVWHTAHTNENSDCSDIENDEGLLIATEVVRSDESFICFLANHIDEIIARMEKLEKALGFYAQQKHVVDDFSYLEIPNNYIQTEFTLFEDGEIARKALDEKEEQE